MRRRFMIVTAGALLVLGSSLSLEPARASGAASIDDTGWWWKAQTNPDVMLPGPPDVAAGQLRVEGAPVDGATAIAAIAVTLVEGEARPVLTLKVAEGGDVGGDQAVLLACQTGSQWVGGSAKPWTEHPQPACEAGGVQGTRSTDGMSWRFDLTTLQFGDKVNVVLVPGLVEGQPEGANGSSFSLTFDPPTTEAIQTSPGEPPPPPTTTTVDTGPGGSGEASSDDGAYTFSSPSSGGGDFSLPPVYAALPEDEQGLTPVAPVVQEQTPVLPASVIVDPRSPHAGAVGIVLLLLGAGLVYRATRQQVPIGPEGVPGGLGRWARPRWGTPPALRG